MSDLGFTDDERERVKEAVHERWKEVEATALTSRQTEARRLAAEMRAVIERLVATQAPEEALRYAADTLARLAVEFDIYPQGKTYEGFAEAANAGGDPSALFDHSPLIGKANPLAPPIEIEVEDDKVIGRVTFGSAYEGPPGCVHGGYLAATFDEVLGGAQSLGGRPGMTGTLTVRYRVPTPLHTPLRFEGELDRVEGRKNFTVGRCYAGDLVTAEAEGIFIAVDLAKMEQLHAAREAR